MRKALRRQRTSIAPHVVPPTPERAQHGAIAEVPAPFADAAGAPSAPWRAIDILAALDRREAITAEMRQAGERFRAQFRAAHLDPLRAADMARVPIARSGGRDHNGAGENARASVWNAVLALGGQASPSGSCLWHVVGWEMSLTRWALEVSWGRRRPIGPQEATGVLIGALGTLAGLDGLDASRHHGDRR